jgi:hypothetical protein
MESAGAAITGTVFSNLDISHIREGSLFVYNNDITDPVTVSLQYSPTTDQSYYFPIDYIDLVVPTTTGTFIALSKLSHYVELTYTAADATPSIDVYYNAQGY